MAAFVSFAALAGRNGVDSRLFVAGLFVAALAVLSVVDIEQRRLPNRLVLPSAATIVALQLVIAPERAGEWLLAPVAAFAAMLVLALLNPAGLGMGDVKLALLLGAGLGKGVLVAVLVGSLGAAVFGLVLLVRHRAGARRATMPYGPFLAAGAVCALLLSE